MRNLTRFAFGATAAIMTSMALIVGLGSAASGKMGVVASLLIIGIADNLSDTLGIHIYEECRVGGEMAVRTSVSNYFTRVFTAFSFVVIVLIMPLDMARWVSVAWGVLLLSTLSYLIAKSREVSPAREVATHLLVAAAVIVLSQIIGSLISRVI